jgi:hypothetical protein
MVREVFWVSALLLATGSCTSKDEGGVSDGATLDAGGSSSTGSATVASTGTEGAVTSTATSGGGTTSVSTQAGGASSGGSGAVTGEAGANGTAGPPLWVPSIVAATATGGRRSSSSIDVL